MKRILYVEDNPEQLALVRQLIELSLPGTVVDVCATAYGAEDMLNAECYDLVICDVKLPGELGTTVIEKILERDREQPVMLMTAYRSEPIKVEVARIVEHFGRDIPLSDKFCDKSPSDFIDEVAQILAADFCRRRQLCETSRARAYGRRPAKLRLISECVRAARRSVAA